MLPGSGVVAGTVVRPGREVARGGEAAGTGEDETGTGDGAAAKGPTARAAGAPATAPSGPPGTTASVIATPAATSTPPAAAAPDRKLTSSIRAKIALFSRPNPAHPLSARHSTIHGGQPAYRTTSSIIGPVGRPAAPAGGSAVRAR
jgi:pyruvate/2-oxoglutarate dehydrogenase complex dihydrolipoamide acyltransferase (E2) component